MPILMFLRQYGLREYAFTLAFAAIVGLGIAVLINSAAGGSAGAPAVLKTKAQLAASAHMQPARVDRPVTTTARARLAVKHRARRVHRVHRIHHSAPAPAPAPTPTQTPRLVATRTPAPQTVTPAPAPVVSKPAPVVHKPAPAPKPKSSGGGGGGQFDDSG
jgi:hypothetical protein